MQSKDSKILWNRKGFWLIYIVYITRLLHLSHRNLLLKIKNMKNTTRIL